MIISLIMVFMFPSHDRHGYAAVTLWIDGVSEKFKVHRLVAEVFLGPAAPDMTVNHKDHDKRNNHVNNLEWVTQSDNTKAAWAAGRMNIGEDVVFSKLKNTDVIAIKHAMVEGLNNQEIAEIFGVARGTISKIRDKITWKHVLPDLELPVTSAHIRPKKLSIDDVKAIRRMSLEGLCNSELARVFKVHNGTIYSIVNYKTYKNI